MPDNSRADPASRGVASKKAVVVTALIGAALILAVPGIVLLLNVADFRPSPEVVAKEYLEAIAARDAYEANMLST